MVYANSFEERRSWGEALRRKRSSMRISQQKLASKVGVTHNTICSYECGGNGISLLIAMNIAEALNWDIYDWGSDADEILVDNSWRRAGRRGKKEHIDDYKNS